ncbi:putative plastoquinol--plastocyanin reductase [Helianthus annuus]|nr:putative plastoquinol--plastocyanin reductase [Helianthus annuus]
MWLCNNTSSPSTIHFIHPSSLFILFIHFTSLLLSTPMAAFTLSPTTPTQLRSGNNGPFLPAQGLMAKSAGKPQLAGRERGMKVTCQAASIPADRVPDMEKRKLMNLLLLGAIGLPTTGMLLPYTYFFVPPG